MRYLTILISLGACSLMLAAGPARIIYDTDMGNDVDDAFGLALLHAFENRHEAKLLAVTISKDNRWSAPFVDLMNTFYGRPGIPIGIVIDGATKADGSYTKATVERKAPGGSPLYPHRITETGAVEDAAVLLRKVLAAEQDGTVTIVQVGFSTNLARLLDSPPDVYSPLRGRELAARKVKLAVLMAGRFDAPQHEYNIEQDLASARKFFAEWPTPIITSGYEVGATILYDPENIDTDFTYVTNHPLADAYRFYRKMPYQEPLWDPSAVLYAVRPGPRYFGLSPNGKIVVDAKAITTLSQDPQGQHHYLTVDDAQRARIKEAITVLASEPPAALR
jgi:inosine-uridine nucleoside N-ribohydrolase